jgi:hypothetical protein
MSTTDELLKRARFLRNAAPQAFVDFHVAFADYTKQQFEKLVFETTERLQIAQGHAQQCKKILDILEGVKNG